MQRRSRKFLERFKLHGNMTRAAEESGIHRVTIWRWLEADEAFSAAFHQAEAEAVERLEYEAWRRAHDGVVREKPLLYQGEVVATEIITEYSDAVLMFLLRARKPEVYRDRHDINLQGRVEHVPLSSIFADTDEAATGR